MNNMFVLIGRIEEVLDCSGRLLVELKVMDSNKEYNFINVTIPLSIDEKLKEYCKVGDMIGVKGRINRKQLSVGCELIAEKISFLSSGKSEVK